MIIITGENQAVTAMHAMNSFIAHKKVIAHRFVQIKSIILTVWYSPVQPVYVEKS